MSTPSKVLKNTGTEKIFPERPAQLLAMMQEYFELQLEAKITKKGIEKVMKLLDALKPETLINKYKESVQSAVVNTNQEEIRPSCSNNHKHRRYSDASISSIDSINDSVLITNKYVKILVFDKARASSNSTHHSNKSTGPSMAVTSSNTRDSDKSAIPSKRMALALSNSTDYSDKSAGPSKKKAVASSNATDHSDESSDQENQTNDDTSQSNERIPPPVAAPEAQEEERHVDLVPIGSGRTLVPRDEYSMVNWKSYSTATRTLLRAVFSREVLATHSLTGRQSPAFPDKPAKMGLDQQKLSDITIAVRERFKVNVNAIRYIMTSKLSDERKAMQVRQMKQEENE